MLKKLVLYLLGWLERSLQPYLQARLDALNERVKVAETAERKAVEAEKDSQAEYAISVARRAGLDEQIRLAGLQEQESQKRLAESRERIKAIDDEAALAKKKLDALTGPDRVRVDL